MNVWRRAAFEELQFVGGAPLRRHLGLASLTLMGIGGTIGAGIFVLTGTAAANYAGPAIAISFVLSGLACLCTALCYAELASMIPAAGSAYTYAYATMGELVGWIVGWSLVLEYLFATSTVAVGWSAYFISLSSELGMNFPHFLTAPPFVYSVETGWHVSGALCNLPAAAVIVALSAILSYGIRGSSVIWSLMTLIKIAVLLLIIGFGTRYVHAQNWSPFVPPNRGRFGEFGWSGVTRGAGVIFFAYIGFDMISTSASEAKRPTRDIPISLIASLLICTVLYVCMSLVMTGLVPYWQLNVPNPTFVAIHSVHSLAWLAPVVNVGAVLGLASAMLVTLYGQTRIFYQISTDGLLPPLFSQVHQTRQTPVHGTWLIGGVAALVAACLPVDILGELVSIGTLLAFSIVCAGVLILRRIAPDADRQFRAPMLIFVAPLGVITCAVMMISLPSATWWRLLIWLAIGAVIYMAYGRRHSRFAAIS